MNVLTPGELAELDQRYAMLTASIDGHLMPLVRSLAARPELAGAGDPLIAAVLEEALMADPDVTIGKLRTAVAALAVRLMRAEAGAR